MKLTILMLFSVVCVLFFAPLFAYASGSTVFLSATVVAPPTINDLDLSSINPDAVPINDTGKIKGISTIKSDSTAQIVALELFAVLLAILFSYFIKRKRRSFTKLEQKFANNSV